eukprot:CAMPEP_0197835012 /NCGR_PEP_ID=MMETSP1437-20131217/24460_1 /TAXON_ID=49252 ORGANISM="Eucampia antarctica, Strain CCMP1452" /NCGR_SAMPLE_ID=MMETSP1437 /ASSEMBLY_ACC=CAM_ASM_001096 /LENGTH=446 /DNA_ID=CAMNT_0043440139 /DNA_START=61 /DNA_END=1401 /DNA_ORIENTATION=+
MRLGSALTFSAICVLLVCSLQVTRAEELVKNEEGKVVHVYKTKRSSPSDPFPNDEYEYPTLYEEADDMLDSALIMYPIASLRKLARGNPEVFSGDDAALVLKEPIAVREFDGIIERNLETLKQNMTVEELKVMDDALDAIVERQDMAGAKHRCIMRQVGDDNSNEELVYAIFVDSALKRVVVSFRGSTTPKDFIQDAKIWIEDIDNPLAGVSKSQPKKLGLHVGFKDYLFDEEESTNGDSQPRLKYDVIVDEVVEVMKGNPGFKLYVTGHSLGAALSSLFAFLASVRDDIPAPVTCVSIASPFVGDKRFRKAFELAESMGKIRYLRVANRKDIVTIVPFLSLRLRLYKHVGVELKLDTKGSSLIYPKLPTVKYLVNAWKRTWRNSLLSNLSLGYLTNHGCSEYNKRLDVKKDYLDSIFLNDLYADKKMIGSLMKNNLLTKQVKDEL